MTQQRDNSGALFANERKTKDTQPDRTGSAMIDGVEYWVSGWINKPKNGGNQYLSMIFKKKEEDAAKSANVDKFDDDIPF